MGGDSEMFKYDIRFSIQNLIRNSYTLSTQSGGGAGNASSDQEAALAAGWVPGRGRDIFKLLRFHVKKNRAQVEALFPPGQDLDITQVWSNLCAFVKGTWIIFP